MSTNVGGMGAHWTAACPRPVDDEVPDCIDPAVLDEALTRAEQLLAVTTHAFDRAPLTGAVQQVLGELFDRPHRRPVGADAGRRDGRRGRRPALDRPRDHRRRPVGAAGRRAAHRHAGPAGRARRRPGDRGRGRRRGHRRAVDDHRPRGRRRRRRLAHPAAAVGLRHPARGARPVPDRAPADHGGVRPGREVRARGRTGRRAAARSRPRRRPGGGAIVPVSGVSWVPYAADRPFHGQVMQMDASPGAAGPGRHRPARPGRRARLVLQEGAVAGQPRLVRRRRDRRARPAGDPDRLRPERRRRGGDRRGEGRDRRGGAGAGPAARRAVRHAAGQLAALPGHHPDGHRRTTAPASATPPAASGAPPTSTSAATTSSRPPPPATRP